jgi:uncharacterized protein (TIGR02145 family)
MGKRLLFLFALIFNISSILLFSLQNKNYEKKETDLNLWNIDENSQSIGFSMDSGSFPNAYPKVDNYTKIPNGSPRSWVDNDEQRFMVYGKWNFHTGDDFAFFQGLTSQAKSYGFNVIRVHIPWFLLQSQSGEIDFTKYDQKIDYVVNTLGLKAAINVDLTRKFSDGNDSVLPPADCMLDYNGNASVMHSRNQFSLASDNALNKACDIFELVVKRYNSRYPSESIIYYEATLSQFCEDEYFPVPTYTLDYSDVAKQKFRIWLQFKYSFIEQLNLEWQTNYESFSTIQPPVESYPVFGIMSNINLDWYRFRHAMLKRALDRFADVVHGVNPYLKYCVQFGSVWDTSYLMRGTLAFTDLCEKADIVIIDDAQDYNHCFSMDLLRGSLPGKWIGNDVDGPMGNSWAWANDSISYNQALQSFQHGAKFVAFDNWENLNLIVPDPEMENHKNMFLNVAQLLQNPVSTGDSDIQQLHISAIDEYKNGISQYLTTYNNMSSNGTKWVDVILDDDLSWKTRLPEFLISGRIFKDTLIQNARVGLGGILLNGLPGFATTDEQGYYSELVSNGWSGTVTPNPSGYKFIPTSISYSNVLENKVEQDYTATATAKVTVMSPKGGENWLVGSTQNITWTQSNITNIKIEYTTNNGTSWTMIIETTSANSGSYLWTIPNTVSINCKIRISDASNNLIMDTSKESFQISAAYSNPCPGTPTVTYSEKIYNTILIGSQCWLKENIDVGTMIQGNQNQSDNSIIEKYCYNNDPNNCITYGGFYQWAEALQYKNGATNSTFPNPAFSAPVQGICPPGWHIPTLTEYQTLVTSVSANGGNALKSIGQGISDGSGTNTSGFSALLGGSRNNDGSFYGLGINTYFWSVTESNASMVYYMGLYNNGGGINIYNGGIYSFDNTKEGGLIVRCLSDENVTEIQEDDEIGLPVKFTLSQNFPNPFNPSTKINYSVPKIGFVTIKVYDILGREVSTLVNEEKLPGNYEVKFDGSNLSSGVYYYQMRAGQFVETKKLILLK